MENLQTLDLDDSQTNLCKWHSPERCGVKRSAEETKIRNHPHKSLTTDKNLS